MKQSYNKFYSFNSNPSFLGADKLWAVDYKANSREDIIAMKDYDGI